MKCARASVCQKVADYEEAVRERKEGVTVLLEWQCRELLFKDFEERRGGNMITNSSKK